MPQFNIIKQNEDFQLIFSKGHSINGRYLVVYFLNNALSVTRFGFCVGRKLGTAVKRNRIKRLEREAVRTLADSIAPGFDILLVAKTPIINAPLNSIIMELRHILTKVKPPIIRSGAAKDSP